MPHLKALIRCHVASSVHGKTFQIWKITNFSPYNCKPAVLFALNCMLTTLKKILWQHLYLVPRLSKNGTLKGTKAYIVDRF